ncbi:MAG: diguanylate cyclase [Desulfobacterales bacterium]|nr:diguanylate cyclase [Desulfobacterales bacterium]
MKILLTGDDSKRKARLRLFMNGMGLDVTEIDAGARPVEAPASQDPHLIVAGVGSGEEANVDVCGSLLDKNIKGPVFTLAVVPEGISIANLQDIFPVDDFLLEPFVQEELAARVQTGMKILSLEAALKEAKGKVRSMSLTDPLTGCYSQSYLLDHLPHEVKRAIRYGRSLSVVSGAIDHLEAICGIWGGGIGDRVLTVVGAVLQESVRRHIDWVARDEQDGFAIVLPETDREGALCLVQRLCKQINEQRWSEDDADIRVTAGFGVAELDVPDNGDPERSAEQLLDSAKKSLKKAQREGMNQLSAGTIGDANKPVGPSNVRAAVK